MANTFTLVLNATTSNTIYWPANPASGDWGAGYPATNSPMLIRATVNGTGAVTATYTIYAGSMMAGSIVYDTAPTSTIILSGTTVDTGSALFTVVPNKYWKIVLSAVSGTGAKTTCVVEF
jgi:hypothetical protein